MTQICPWTNPMVKYSSLVIYDVDSLWDFGASGILPPFHQRLKIFEATKSEGLWCSAMPFLLSFTTSRS
jgi:hypothetical protein